MSLLNEIRLFDNNCELRVRRENIAGMSTAEKDEGRVEQNPI